MEAGVRPQTSGAGAPHPVQRRLQVTAPPQRGSRESRRGRTEKRGEESRKGVKQGVVREARRKKKRSDEKEVGKRKGWTVCR